MNGRPRAKHSRWWYVLLLPPFVGLLIPPFYTRTDPTVIGLPFFYWYQFVWVPVAALLTWLVYRATAVEAPPERPEERRP